MGMVLNSNLFVRLFYLQVVPFKLISMWRLWFVRIHRKKHSRSNNLKQVGKLGLLLPNECGDCALLQGHTRICYSTYTKFPPTEEMSSCVYTHI